MTARAKVKKRHPQAWCWRYRTMGWPPVCVILPRLDMTAKPIGIGLTEREAWESAERRGK